MKRYVLTFLLIAAFSTAHEELSDQVKIVTEKIKTDPKNASLYFERAELYRADSHWSFAEKDYMYARKLSPGMSSVDLGLGLLYYDTKRWKESLKELNRFLIQSPDHVVARITRGRVFRNQGDYPGAIEDFSHTLKIQADPALYIERARLLASLNKPEEALSGLNDGIARLGPVVTMELYAIELELSLKRFDSALERVDQISRQSERKESWLVRRAEILHLASRDSEAKEAYRRALEEIDKLPDSRKGTRFTRDLQKKIEFALEQLATDPLQ